MTNSESTHYVYRHLRLDDKTPFYIGLGTKPKRYVTPQMEYKRAFNLNARSKDWNTIYKEHGVIVEIVFECDNYKDAEKKEIELISIYGKENSGVGYLVNKSDGGKGTKGIKRTHSEETKKRLSEIHKGKKISKEHAEKLHIGRKNWVITDAQRERYSLSKKGIKHSEERRMKNSIAKSMGNHPSAKRLINNETGAIYSCVKEAAIMNGLSYLKMVRVLNGITKKSNQHEAITKFSFI